MLFAAILLVSRMEWWNSGILARPGATNVKNADSGETDDQLFIRRTLYGFGLGQGRLGMKSGKRSILQKRLYLHFMMMPFRHPFSAPVPENTPRLRENQYNYIRFDSLNPPFHYPRTHDSLRGVGSTSRRPIFQNSNISIGAKPLTCFEFILRPFRPILTSGFKSCYRDQVLSE